MEEEINHEQYSIRPLSSAIWLYSCSFGKVVCPNAGFTVLEHRLCDYQHTKLTGILNGTKKPTFLIDID